MTFFRIPRPAIGLTTAVSLVALQTSTALAFDPSGNEVADTFLAMLDAEEGSVESYSAVDTSGNSVIISDLVIKDDGDDDVTVTIAKSTLTDGEVQGNGRLKLSALGLENLKLTADDGGMSLQSLEVTDLVLPSVEEVKSDSAPANPGYRTFEASVIQINDENGKIADIEKISSSIDSMDGDLPTSGQFSVSGAVFDVKQLADDDGKELLELGYETLSVDLSGSGKWDPDAETLVVPDIKIDAKDAASLSISFSLGGVSRDVVTQLEANSENPEKAMEHLQKITVSDVKIRLDDDSLTGRILDHEASKAGVETPQFVAGLTGTLPLMLGMLQNKELEGQVAEAVTEFLTTPGSLEIVAKPGSPVPVAQIVGTAMFAPQTIPQILSVGIMANQ